MPNKARSLDFNSEKLFKKEYRNFSISIFIVTDRPFFSFINFL